MFDANDSSALRNFFDGLPPGSEIVGYAKTTDSVDQPGSKMFLDENIEDGVATPDIVALMKKYYGVDATLTKYETTYDNNGTPVLVATAQDGQRALSDVEAALARGDAAHGFGEQHGDLERS